ncbi:MAG TPA: porin [Gemmatimonadaceae bacterium]|nr:porin [Gemmatimonadaceae bacterium]
MTRLLPRAAALALACSLTPRAAARAQGTPSDTSPVRPTPVPPRRPWYERLSIRGYTQVRYNRLLESNPRLTCPQCDRSIGRNGGFFIRRARLVVSGDVSDRVHIYIQPDLATDAAGQLHYAQIRDAYFDLYFDKAKTLRARIGQSKVPYGWENLQSSSNRLPLDRADPTNSGVPNERDLGVFLYWANATARARFRILTDSGLKGTGDYGVLGFGVYNGQTANRPEANDGQHAVLRLTYPFRLPNGQFVEASVQGYSGRFVVTRSTGVGGGPEFDDERVAGSLVVYPQPLGLQAEWNVGRGPEFDHNATVVRTRHLEGGYVQTMLRTRPGAQVVTPFVRAQQYRGGRKLDTDARSQHVRELEGGVEWLPFAAFELTASYVASDRTAEDAADPHNRQKGHFLRLQAQFNY